MKATMHAGRTNAKGQAYNVNHNDRKFEQDKSKDYDKHIDWDKSDQNYYFTYKLNDTPELTYRVIPEQYDLRDIELGFYKKHFGAHLQEQNEKHIKSRHKERCRTIEDIYTNPRTCPQEFILQVGKDGEYKDEKKFRKMVTKYCESYNAHCSDHSFIISGAIHKDETSLHAHVRRVFYVQDENGNKMLAQDKALEQMGYELPNPNQKRSKYNNRLQSFTDEMREFWYQTIESIDKSVIIDREPNTSSKRQLEKLDYQNKSAGEKLEKKQAELDSAESQLETIKAQADELDAEVGTMRDLAKFAEKAISPANEEYDFQPKRKNPLSREVTGTVIDGIEPKKVKEVFDLSASLQAQLERQKAEREQMEARFLKMRKDIAAREEQLAREKEQVSIDRKMEIAKAVADATNKIKREKNEQIYKIQEELKYYKDLEKRYPESLKRIKDQYSKDLVQDAIREMEELIPERNQQRDDLDLSR